MRFIVVILFVFCFADGVNASAGLYFGLPNVEEFEYYSAILEAHNGNYKLAERYLESGWNRSGKEKFLPELAGASYRLGETERAKEYLFQILKKDPGNHHANYFLGTLFLLDQNLEACLKYWNRIGRPLIEEIKVSPSPRIDPEIMDKAFAVAPASELKLEDYLATDLRLRTMEVFGRYQFKLRPYRDEEKFDLVLEPSIKRNSLSSRVKIAGLIGQAVFAETIKPEFHNIGGTTASSKSLISWDEFRNRFYTSLSLPLEERADQRIRMFVDVRNETWALGSNLDLTKWEAGLEFGENLNSRINWNSGSKISNRNYDDLTFPSSQEFQQGWAVHVFGNINSSFLRIPEKRFEMNSVSSAELGKLLSGSSFFTLNESIEFRWFPHPRGEDLAMNGRFSTGKIFGDGPFDEYFVLGVERDSDLPLRAHKSSIDKKGGNPFSPAYVLWNWDISKMMLTKNLWRWRLTPFVDVGKVFGSNLWKEEQWFLDTGIQSGFQVLRSVEVVLTYGKDLRNGKNVVYISAKL